MRTRKVLQGRNPRLSLNQDEIEYLIITVNNEVMRNKKFDKENMLFLLSLLKKLERL